MMKRWFHNKEMVIARGNHQWCQFGYVHAVDSSSMLKVRREYFEKGDLLTEVVIYYASKDALLGMGIDLSENPKVSEEESMPKAFNTKYCQPPKNWNG